MQALLPCRNGERRGPPEIYDLVPGFGGPGPRTWGIFGMDEESLQELIISPKTRTCLPSRTGSDESNFTRCRR
jgi:hypothetical protein